MSPEEKIAVLKNILTKTMIVLDINEMITKSGTFKWIVEEIQQALQETK